MIDPLNSIERRSTPKEQAWPLQVLNGPCSGSVTGQSLLIDGGLLGPVHTGRPT
jgi:hypothetical protein